MAKLCDCLFPSQCWQKRRELSSIAICRIREGSMPDDDDLFQWASRVNRKLSEDEKE